MLLLLVLVQLLLIVLGRGEGRIMLMLSVVLLFLVLLLANNIWTLDEEKERMFRTEIINLKKHWKKIFLGWFRACWMRNYNLGRRAIERVAMRRATRERVRTRTPVPSSNDEFKEVVGTNKDTRLCDGCWWRFWHYHTRVLVHRH